MARRAKPWFWKERQEWFVTVAGVRQRLGADKTAAWKRFHELMREPAKARPSTDSLPTVVDAFLDWVKAHRSSETFEWYRQRLQLLVERYPKMRVSELRPFHVQQWVDERKGLKQTTKRNYLRTVKRCLSWAKQQGYIDVNPVEHLEVPGAERR